MVLIKKDMFDLLEQKPRVLAALSRNDTQMRKTHHVNAFSQERGDGEEKQGVKEKQL